MIGKYYSLLYFKDESLDEFLGRIYLQVSLVNQRVF